MTASRASGDSSSAGGSLAEWPTCSGVSLSTLSETLNFVNARQAGVGEVDHEGLAERDHGALELVLLALLLGLHELLLDALLRDDRISPWARRP